MGGHAEAPASLTVAISRNEANVQHGGRIVAGVDAREGVENGFAQISFGVGKAHTFVDGGGQVSLYKHILPDVGEHDRHAGVLTDRAEFFPRELLVFEQLVEHVLCRAASDFPITGGGERRNRIFGEVAAGTQAEPAYGFDELCGLNDPHAAAAFPCSSDGSTPKKKLSHRLYRMTSRNFHRQR